MGITKIIRSDIHVSESSCNSTTRKISHCIVHFQRIILLCCVMVRCPANKTVSGFYLHGSFFPSTCMLVLQQLHLWEHNHMVVHKHCLHDNYMCIWRIFMYEDRIKGHSR